MTRHEEQSCRLYIMASHGRFLENRERERLELEVVSSEARLRLTRMLRQRVNKHASEGRTIIIRQNSIVNIANGVMNRPIYVLEADDGEYDAVEYAWHQGELELVLRRPTTVQLVEILADLIQEGWMESDAVNEILESDRCGVCFRNRGDEVEIEIGDVSAQEEKAEPDENANVRRLFDRMDRAMQDADWPLVLHSGASIFETLAKLVVPLMGVQNQPLGSFFSAFRKHSKLAVPLLDTIEAIYKRRNIEPLAGHGAASDPGITREEAIQVSTLTRALVRLERELANPPASKAKSKMSKK